MSASCSPRYRWFLVLFLTSGITGCSTEDQENLRTKLGQGKAAGTDNSSEGVSLSSDSAASAGVAGILLANFDSTVVSTLFPTGSAEGTNLRVSVQWGSIETAAGVFKWDPANLKVAMAIPGGRVQPVIRLASSWAVTHPKSTCTSAPADIDRAAPLAVDKVYSKTFYNFMLKFAQRYSDRFAHVVIENEMNDPEFWCDSAEDYLRVLSTAKKAFIDAGSKMNIVDGGLQGSRVLWQMIHELLDKGQDSDAEKLYLNAFGGAKKAAELRSFYTKIAGEEAQLRTAKLISLGLWRYPHTANFHYYRLSKGLPALVSYIKARAGTLPVITNETGVVTPFAIDARAASVEMVKRFATLQYLQVQPITWFGPTKIHVGGMFDFEQSPPKQVATTTAAFAQIRQLFNEPTLTQSFEYFPGNQLSRYTFKRTNGYVSIWWGEGAAPVAVNVANCKISDFLGNAVTTTPGLKPDQKSINVGTDPIFVRCGT